MSRQFKYENPICIMKITTDNWYPNYENNMVKLSYIGKLRNGKFRVCVWGADDFGLDYDTNTKAKARKMFRKLQNKKILTQQNLYDLGFINS